MDDQGQKEIGETMLTRNQYFLKKATFVYFLSLIGCCVIFFHRLMPWYSFVSGVTSIVLFNVFLVRWESLWKNKNDKAFERSLFVSALCIRLCWIFLYYWFTNAVWGTPWEQPEGTSMDSTGYYYEALWARDLFDRGLGVVYLNYLSQRVSDAGYPLLLLLLNTISDSSILFTRIPNAFFDAWTTVLVYRLAGRAFDKKTGQTAAIFAVLMPMMIFYTGLTMKESLMLMLTMMSLNLGDKVIRDRRPNVRHIVSFVLCALLLLLFRDVLMGVVAVAFLSAFIISSPNLKQASQRTIVIALVVTGVLFVFGGALLQESDLLESQLAMTEGNFINRSRDNTLVSYLSKGMLFPFLFTVPFPTMVDIPGQYIQAIQNGGFYLKNILSFFCILGVVDLFVQRKWREVSFPLEFLLGYLIVLGLSSFAHSGRFHHPVLGVELIFAAYGINAIRNIRQARLFNYYLVLEFVLVIGWNWFKLKGRGL